MSKMSTNEGLCEIALNIYANTVNCGLRIIKKCLKSEILKETFNSIIKSLESNAKKFIEIAEN